MSTPRSTSRSTLAVRRRLVATLLASAIAATPMLAAAAAPEPAFAAAYQQFVAAQQGDSAAIDAADAQFTALLAADPANPVLLAYTGAATALKARTTLLPWKKMSYAEDGLAQIDKALAMLQPAHDAPIQRQTPGSLETRFVAASTFLSLPSMFNRGPRGAQLLAEVQASPLFAQSPAGFQQAVHARAAAEAAR